MNAQPDDARPLELAIQRMGSQVALAVACKVTPQAVNQWVVKGKPPADKVLAIEAASGVSRHDLRPDIFGPASVAKEISAPTQPSGGCA